MDNAKGCLETTYLLLVVTYGEGSLMVWAGIFWNSLDPLIALHGCVTANIFIKYILYFTGPDAPYDAITLY